MFFVFRGKRVRIFLHPIIFSHESQLKYFDLLEVRMFVHVSFDQLFIISSKIMMVFLLLLYTKTLTEK